MLITVFLSLLLFFSSIVFFKPNKNDIYFIFFLSLYHYIFSHVFLLFSKDKITDSSNYFVWSSIKSYDELSYTSTDLIIRLVKLIGEFNLGYNEIFLIFSFISGLAIIGMFSYFSKNYFYYSQSIINKYTLFLLPGLHFWTVSIGKDALCILAFYFICSSKLRGNSLKLTVGLIILLLVRYHILVFLIISFGIYVFSTSNFKYLAVSKGLRRLIISLFAIPVSIFLYRRILSSIQKYSASGFDGIESFIDNRSDAYAETGSGILLASQPYIVKVFALLFGGVPWISIDLLSLAAMLEGVIVLVIMFRSLKFFVLNKKKLDFKIGKIEVLLWFILIFTLIMPLISSNLGLMVRMRVMIYFPLMFIFIYSRYLSNLKFDYSQHT